MVVVVVLVLVDVDVDVLVEVLALVDVDVDILIEVLVMDIAFNVSSSFVRFLPSTNKPFVQLHAPSTSSVGAFGSVQVSEERPRRWVDTAEDERRRLDSDLSFAVVSRCHCSASSRWLSSCRNHKSVVFVLQFGKVCPKLVQSCHKVCILLHKRLDQLTQGLGATRQCNRRAQGEE